MKRIIALVLTLFIFAIVPVASAAGTATLSITASDIDPETGVFYISLMGDTKVLAASVSIDYDGSKVALYDIDTDDGESTIEDQADAEYAFKLPNSGMFSKITLNAEESYMKVDWFKTSAVRANKEVWQAYFIAKDKTGESFDADTFKLVTDDDVLTTLTVKGNGGNVQWTDDASVKYHAESTENTVAVTFSYPNSDVVVGGGDDEEPEEEEFGIASTGSALAGTDTMKDENGADVAAAGDKVVAIFSKNISDEELAAGSYGIIFGGVRYAGQAAVPAKAAWAIKLVGSAEQLPAGSYSYGVYAGNAVVNADSAWVIE